MGGPVIAETVTTRVVEKVGFRSGSKPIIVDDRVHGHGATGRFTSAIRLRSARPRTQLYP